MICCNEKQSRVHQGKLFDSGSVYIAGSKGMWSDQ